MTLLMLARGSVRRRLEMGVAVSSFCATGHDHLIAGLLEVGEQMAAVAIAHQGSRGDLDQQDLATAPKAIRALAVLAAACFPVPLMREVSQVGMALRSTNDHAAAVA